MKTFIIKYASQSYYGHGFYTHVIRMKGAHAAWEIVRALRHSRVALQVWVTIEWPKPGRNFNINLIY